MTNYDQWEQARGKVISKKGGWRIGDGVKSHGFDLLREFVGNYSYMQLVILNATGKMPSKELATWVEAVYCCLSWPDPRIWCNRIGALGATVDTTVVSAVSAGLMAADSKYYGMGTLPEGVEFIQRAKKFVDEGGDVEGFVDCELKKYAGKPFFMGYARPLAKGDERIDAMEAVALELGFKSGVHMDIAKKIESTLHKRFDETMNINGYMSAFLSDQSYSPDDVYNIFSVLVFSGVVACYVDESSKAKKSFSCLRVEDIDFQGQSARSIPTMLA